MTALDSEVRTEAWARSITERIRYTGISVRDGIAKLQRLVTEAQDGGAHELLGYASWTAYLADIFKDEPLVLPRDLRPEVTNWLSREGLSTRAIAAVVGASRETVRRDIAGDTNVSPAPAPAPAAAPDVIDAEVIEPEATVTPISGFRSRKVEAVRRTSGLDGKTYPRRKPAPPPRPAAAAMPSLARAIAKRAADLDYITSSPNFYRHDPPAVHAREDIERAIELLTKSLAAIDEGEQREPVPYLRKESH